MMMPMTMAMVEMTMTTQPWRSGSLAAHWTWTVEPSEKWIVSTHLLPFGWNTVKGGGSSGCGGGGLSSTGREASRWRAQRIMAYSTLIADLLAYLLTYFLTYLLTYLITCLLTNSVTLVLTYLLTHLIAYLLAYLLAY